MPLRRRLLRVVAATSTLPIATLVAASSATAAGAPAARSAAPTSLSSDFALSVGPSATYTSTPTGCSLAHGVQHVFYIGFDNFHLRRDNSNSVAANGDDNYNTDTGIPSDLEQVPALYNFLRGTANAGTTANPPSTGNYADGRSTTYADGTAFPGGVVLANEHTPLISHTSVDFTTTYTGLYGDRHGVAVSQNSMAAYNGTAYSSAPNQAVSTQSGFSYWTDPFTADTSGTNVLTTPNGSGGATNTPAPWVPFTRAGCDVGAVSTTGFVLENAGGAAALTKATGTTYTTGDEGVAIHCAATTSSICATTASDPNVKVAPDILPSEPGGYSGYQAIYGNEYAVPAINDGLPTGSKASDPHNLNLLRQGDSAPLPGPAAADVDTFHYGSTASTTASRNYAFPGFSSEDANYTLGYTLAMQKAGVPVTFGYLSDAHDCHYPTGIIDDYNGTTGALCANTNVPGTTARDTYDTFGSGEQGYHTYLTQLNHDFQLFFSQAKAAGYTTANTEFVFYSDENDHTSEATPANPTCDGVTTFCQYNHSESQTSTNVSGQLGESTIKLDTLVPPTGSSTLGTPPYFTLADSAPDFYAEQPGAPGAPAQSSTAVRALERTLTSQQVPNPYTGAQEPLLNYAADQTELAALHMVTADPQRTPTVTGFAPGQDYVEAKTNATANTDCGSATTVSCSNAQYGYVHGDYAPETNTTWAGFAGPGVANLGTTTQFTDHVDIRPTLLALVGLTDDYASDGRVITEITTPGTLPASAATSTATQLGTLLKQLNSPTYNSAEGANDGFGPATLVADTEALKSGNASNDSTYTDVTGRIATITAQRNAVVSDIQARLTAADSGTPIDPAAAATDQANGQCLLAYANQLKTYAASPSSATAPTSCNVVTGPPAQTPEIGHAPLLVVAGGTVLAGGILVAGRRRGRREAAA